jgi:nucleoside-diphosphate-sugar epimerase
MQRPPVSGEPHLGRLDEPWLLGPVTVAPLKARRHRSRCLSVPISLVTGGAGFIGSHLCDYRLALGHRLICIDNLDTGSLQNIEYIAHHDAFVFVNHDLTQPLFLDHDVDHDFHLASPASPIDYEALQVDDHRVRLPDITRAHELRGWEPEISLEDGLRRLAASRDAAARGAGSSSGHAGKPAEAADAAQPSD